MHHSLAIAHAPDPQELFFPLSVLTGGSGGGASGGGAGSGGGGGAVGVGKPALLLSPSSASASSASSSSSSSSVSTGAGLGAGGARQSRAISAAPHLHPASSPEVSIVARVLQLGKRPTHACYMCE